MAYAIDSILCQSPKTGVALLLATPVTNNNDESDNSQQFSSSRCLVRCGPPVVIKAAPHHNANEGIRHDNPVAEIAALQYLTVQRQYYKMKDPHHPHVIHLLDCCQDDHFVYMVLPYLVSTHI